MYTFKPCISRTRAGSADAALAGVSRHRCAERAHPSSPPWRLVRYTGGSPGLKRRRPDAATQSPGSQRALSGGSFSPTRPRFGPIVQTGGTGLPPPPVPGAKCCPAASQLPASLLLQHTVHTALAVIALCVTIRLVCSTPIRDGLRMSRAAEFHGVVLPIRDIVRCASDGDEWDRWCSRDGAAA